MIINAKATRQEAGEQAPAQPYRFTEETKNSRWPLPFAAVLMGIALYIKSMFPGWNEAEAEARPEENPYDETGKLNVLTAARPLREAGMQYSPAETSEEKTDPVQDWIGSGAKLFDLNDPASFGMIISPGLELMEYKAFGPILTGPFNFPGAFAAANDNPGPNTADTGTVDPGDGKPEGDGPDESGGPDHESDDEDEKEINRAPRVNGPVYLADVGGCSIALIGLTDLLANAVDPDGDALSVTNVAISSGMLTQADGGWLFDSAGYGPVMITYQITDGALSVTQSAYFNVVRNSVAGTSGDDLLLGTECGDDIDGGDGDDNIDARGGNDIVLGGVGNDHVVAGAGNDIVYTGVGNDIVFGGDGDDWISGGDGDDLLFGETGDDTLFGDKGDDYLSGGDGRDLLFGGAGNDYLSGGRQDDRLLGNSGNDELIGGEGNDVLMGESGVDRLGGEAGNDTLSGGEGEDQVFAGDGDDTVTGDLDGANDYYDGGAGIDTIDYSAATASISFDLVSGKVTGIEVGDDSISDFEIFVGGGGNDHFKGDGRNASFFGGAGDDLFEFGALSTPGQSVAYEIVDFMAGDRIKVSRYEIFEQVMDSLEDRFEEAYGDHDEDDLPILISHEYTGNVRSTLIEADLNSDDHYELAITIYGNSHVTVVETV